MTSDLGQALWSSSSGTPAPLCTLHSQFTLPLVTVLFPVQKTLLCAGAEYPHFLPLTGPACTG